MQNKNMKNEQTIKLRVREAEGGRDTEWKGGRDKIRDPFVIICEIYEKNIFKYT